MSKNEIHFLGLLANANSSITNVNLIHGFRIESISKADGDILFPALENLPPSEVRKKLFIYFPCFNSEERKYYFISNSFTEVRGPNTELFDNALRFENKFVENYLESILRLMRLFREGNICMPLTYYYTIENNVPKVVSVNGHLSIFHENSMHCKVLK